jgi:hypothetical protein
MNGHFAPADDRHVAPRERGDDIQHVQQRFEAAIRELIPDQS